MCEHGMRSCRPVSQACWEGLALALLCTALEAHASKWLRAALVRLYAVLERSAYICELQSSGVGELGAVL